jgi:DNA-binding ferritin-like protein
VGASFQQDLRTAQKAIGKKVENTTNKKSPGVLAAVGKSLTSSISNISSRYTAIKHGIEPIGLKIETLWRGYVNNFSKQGKLLEKFKTDVNSRGKLDIEASAIKEKYENLKSGDVIPPELRARHQALINKTKIMTNFANLIAQNRSAAPDPSTKYNESSSLATFTKTSNLRFQLPYIYEDEKTLNENISTVVSRYNSAKDYTSRKMYTELYNHLKSIKRWQDSATFKETAEELVNRINTLLPKELEVLPEFKPKPAQTPTPLTRVPEVLS